MLSSTTALSDEYDRHYYDSNCQSIIDESGLTDPQGFISKETTTQWYSGEDENKLLWLLLEELLG